MKTIPIAFLIDKGKDGAHEHIQVKATKFNLKGKPVSWGIYGPIMDSCMSKDDGVFYPEPSNSHKDKEFYKTFRFKTAFEAKKCYNKFYKKKGYFKLRTKFFDKVSKRK